MRILLAIILILSLIYLKANARSYRVGGYTTKRGTYVQPHRKTYSDGRKFNNYSTRGNYNPYTGRKGYKNWY